MAGPVLGAVGSIKSPLMYLSNGTFLSMGIQVFSTIDQVMITGIKQSDATSLGTLQLTSGGYEDKVAWDGAALSSSQSVIAWGYVMHTSPHVLGGAFCQLISCDGSNTPVAIGSPTTIDPSTNYFFAVLAVKVAKIYDGGFIVIYLSAENDGSPHWYIRGQRFDSSGTTVGSIFTVLNPAHAAVGGFMDRESIAITSIRGQASMIVAYTTPGNVLTGQRYDLSGTTPTTDGSPFTIYTSTTVTSPVQLVSMLNDKFLAGYPRAGAYKGILYDVSSSGTPVISIAETNLVSSSTSVYLMESSDGGIIALYSSYLYRRNASLALVGFISHSGRFWAGAANVLI